MKSNFLALAEQASSPCLCRSSACSRERSELPPGFFSLAHPTDTPVGRTDGRIATAGTGRQEAKTIPWNRHQVAKEFILLLQQKMNARFIARQDFSHGLTTCAALSVLSVQRTHLSGADLLLLQSRKGFQSSDCTVSKGSLQVAAKMTEVILITSGALPSSVSRLWILEGIRVCYYSWVFRSPLTIFLLFSFKKPHAPVMCTVTAWGTQGGSNKNTDLYLAGV